jgi:hypothetical protein
MADPGTPLCTAAQFSSGAYADLAAFYQQNSQQPLEDILLEATRGCEEIADRRLVPFTVTGESHRAEGIDPDEYADSANLPMDLQGTLGRSYAYALGASTLVRHCWLNEFAPRYPDMWRYSNVSITIVRSYGGSEVLTGQQITGPDTDSGHVWFQLGTFLPIGSYVYVSYGGGYSPVPAALVRACKYKAAAIIVRELNPQDSSHNPDLLEQSAEKIMERWARA